MWLGGLVVRAADARVGLVEEALDVDAQAEQTTEDFIFQPGLLILKADPLDQHQVLRRRFARAEHRAEPSSVAKGSFNGSYHVKLTGAVPSMPVELLRHATESRIVK